MCPTPDCVMVLDVETRIHLRDRAPSLAVKLDGVARIECRGQAGLCVASGHLGVSQDVLEGSTD